jgi:hypothetical protein
VSLKEEAGSLHRVKRGGMDLQCIVTYHPAGIIYRPPARSQLVEDLTLGWELCQG